MKKKFCLLLLLFIISTFLLTGCFTKSKLEPNDFVDLIEQNDYKTTNVKDSFSSFPQITNAFIAQNAEMTYQIEYYEFNNNESAKTFFEGNKKVFAQNKPNKKTSEDTAKSQKYTQSTDEVYSLVSRIDNTVIYANVKIKYKDDVDKIIKTLGY